MLKYRDYAKFAELLKEKDFRTLSAFEKEEF